jgi:hypothetical protein
MTMIGDSLPTWISLFVVLFANVVGWIITITTTRQRLSDHILECEKRYASLHSSHERQTELLQEMRDNMPRRWFK